MERQIYQFYYFDDELEKWFKYDTAWCTKDEAHARTRRLGKTFSVAFACRPTNHIVLDWGGYIMLFIFTLLVFIVGTWSKNETMQAFGTLAGLWIVAELFALVLLLVIAPDLLQFIFSLIQ